MPAKFTLIYFNIRGRAELARLLFAQAGIEYEDKRIEREQWLDLKEKTPCGQLPVLEVDGVYIAQSMSIARYLARQFNLAGKDAFEQARADMIIDCCGDLVNFMGTIFHEKDEDRKKQMEGRFKNELFPKFLERIERLLVQNGGKYFVGNEVTWADIGVADLINSVSTRIESDCLEKHKPLRDHKTAILSLPKIAAWIEKRPKTAM